MRNSRRTLITLGGCLCLSQFLGSCGIFRRGGADEVATTANDAAQVQATRPQATNQTRSGQNNNYGDGISATVNGKVITRSEVRDAIVREKFLLQQQVFTPAERKRREHKLETEGLDALIERELILAEYNKRGVPVKPQHVDAQVNFRIRQQFGGDRQKFVAALRQSGITLRKFREEQVKTIKVLRMKQAIARDKTRPPSPSEVQSYYKKHINDYRDDEGTLRVRTLTVPKRPRRGIIDKQTLQPLLTINAFNLKAGETSEIIEDNINYYILFVESRQYGKAKPLSEVREDVENNIVADQKQAIVDKWVKNLRDRALIKRY